MLGYLRLRRLRGTVATNKELVYVLLATMLYFIVFSFVATILARYSRDLGIGIESTSIIWSLLFLVAFLLRPLAGYLADRYGFIKIMLLGSVTLVFAIAVYVLYPTFEALIIGRVVQGISSAFFISPSITASAVLAGTYAGYVLGFRSTIISFSNVVIPPIAGLIADNYGYVAVFITALVTSLILVTVLSLVLGRVRDVALTPSDILSWSQILRHDIVLVSITGSMLGILFMSITGILQMHYRDLGFSASTYGLLSMLMALSSMLTRMLSGRLLTRYRAEAISLTGFALVILSTLLLSRYYIIPYCYVVITIFGLGVGLIIPANQYRVVMTVSKGGKNRAIAILNMGFDSGSFLGPIIYGHIASRFSYVISYQFMSLPALIAMIILLYLWRRTPFEAEV